MDKRVFSYLLLFILFLFAVQTVLATHRVTPYSPTNGTTIRGTSFNLSVGMTKLAAAGPSNRFNVTWTAVAGNTATIIGSRNSSNGSTNDARDNETLSVLFDTTTLADGLYNFTVNVTVGNDSADNFLANISNITIDNTAPTIAMNTPVLNTFINGNMQNISLNFTISDAKSTYNQTGTQIRICNYYIGAGNSSGGVAVNVTDGLDSTTANISNGSTILQTFLTANLTTLPDGIHSIGVQCIHSFVGFTNGSNATNVSVSTNRSVTFDETAPTAALQYFDSQDNNLTEVFFGDTVTLSCTATDATAGSNYTEVLLQGPSATSFSSVKIDTSVFTSSTAVEFDTDATQELGTYSVRCNVTDRAGNSILHNSTFEVVTKPPIHTSGFSVPGFAGPVGSVKIASGETKDAGVLSETGSSWLMKTGSAVKFSVKGQDHSVTIKDVTDDAVTLEVASQSFEVKLNKGETKLIDVDKDGTADIEATFHKRFQKTADMTFKLTTAPAPPEEGEETTVPGGEVTPPEAPSQASNAGLWITVIVVIAIVVIGFTLIKGKKK